MLKDAMLTLEAEYGLASRGFLRACIHDALVCLCHKRDVDWVAEAMQSVMQRPQEKLGGLVIDAEVAVGRTWDKHAMEEWRARESVAMA